VESETTTFIRYNIMTRVIEIAFTGYPVTDITRARAFYEGVLGLKSSSVFGSEGKNWIEYDIGPGTIAITNMSPEWKPSTSGPAIALEVADFDEAITALRAAAVKFLIEPTNSPVCKLAVVLDPDGNSLAIHKRNAG
jgi:predicted enzyme related to lactoylglutathione lyase